MESKIEYNFSANIWQYTGPNGWYFVFLPNEISHEIREQLKWQEAGWGRMKAIAKVGTSQWDTAIWFDTTQHTYLLPLKATIRQKEGLRLNDDINVTIWL